MNRFLGPIAVVSGPLFLEGATKVVSGSGMSLMSAMSPEEIVENEVWRVEDREGVGGREFIDD